MKLVGFTVRKPKPFSYKPLYYDERKEELENLKKKYNNEGKTEGVSEEFKDRLRSAWKIKEKRTGNISRTTLLIYLALAAFLLYVVFFR